MSAATTGDLPTPGPEDDWIDVFTPMPRHVVIALNDLAEREHRDLAALTLDGVLGLLVLAALAEEQEW